MWNLNIFKNFLKPKKLVPLEETTLTFSPDNSRYERFLRFEEPFYVWYNQAFETLYHHQILDLPLAVFDDAEFARLPQANRRSYLEQTISEAELNEFVKRIQQFCTGNGDPSEVLKLLVSLYYQDQIRPVEIFLQGDVGIVFESYKERKRYLTMTKLKDDAMYRLLVDSELSIYGDLI
jgi:hypothetical protein